MSATPIQPPPSPEISPVMLVEGKEYPVIEIRATGDIILDVTFENTSTCNKSIPSNAIKQMRASRTPIQSVRMFYRVRLETLKKQSGYFARLFSPNFAEGTAIENAFSMLAKSNLKPTEIGPAELPRIKIMDEAAATQTIGREVVFRDMLKLMHGADVRTATFNTDALAILCVMGDRYNTLQAVARFVQQNFVNYKYPVTADRNVEEVLRQKILIFYYSAQNLRLVAATKELILRGSVVWSEEIAETDPAYQTAWWDLPRDLETELAHRRACVLRTITSIQTQFLELYSSRDRQCKLGYDSSSSCDSFQLGEMVKFLTRKSLLHLVPLQVVSPEDTDYIWPAAYKGDIEGLIGILRQCPNYQIDQYHSHCGLRTKLLPALDYIKTCIDLVLGVRINSSKSGDIGLQNSWIVPKVKANKKSFVVGNKDVGKPTKVFRLAGSRDSARLDPEDSREVAKAIDLFTADERDWILEAGSDPIGWRRPTYKAMP